MCAGTHAPQLSEAGTPQWELLLERNNHRSSLPLHPSLCERVGVGGILTHPWSPGAAHLSLCPPPAESRGLPGAGSMPGSALGLGTPTEGPECLQVGDSLISVCGPGWQHPRRPVLGGEALLWTLALLRGGEWGVDLRIQPSVAWHLLLWPPERVRLRSPISAAPTKSDLVTPHPREGPRGMICSEPQDF